MGRRLFIKHFQTQFHRAVIECAISWVVSVGVGLGRFFLFHFFSEIMGNFDSYRNLSLKEAKSIVRER